MSNEPYRCADSSEARQEPLFGTASVVRRWLMLEQPGGWGRDALTESRMPRATARVLRARASSVGARIVLIRKGAQLASERRRCYFARTEDCDTYLSEVSLDSLDDLLDIDMSPLHDGGVIAEADEHPGPLFLVCTHGRHDACCAIRGNQVSRIACSHPGVDAWESSHIGGDRFAANLVCFPHGVYYGRVAPGETASLIETYRAGRLSLEHYRGRCCFGFALQAADYFVRRDMELLGVDDVSLAAPPETTLGRLSASFLVPGGAVRVEVAVDETQERYRLTCGSREPEAIPRYRLVSLES